MLTYVFLAIWVAVLITLAVYDIKWGRLPNKIVLPSIFLSLLINGFFVYGWTVTIQGFSIGLITALIFYFLFVKAMQVEMGGGDFKLLILMGCVLGYPWVLFGIVGGIVAGGAVTVFLLAARRKNRTEGMPFAPFLCGAGVVALVMIGVNVFLGFTLTY